MIRKLLSLFRPRPQTAPTVKPAPGPKTQAEKLWLSRKITGFEAQADWFVKHCRVHRSRYALLERTYGVPWFVIAVIHSLEASLKFSAHLHNGDPLTARTVNVPAGRPLFRAGNPPFTWEASAVDALAMKGWLNLNDWTLATILERLERYNGLGYRNKGLNSPYLWSGTNHHTRGKYTRDGVYDPDAVSKQAGCVVLLDALERAGLIQLS